MAIGAPYWQSVVSSYAGLARPGRWLVLLALVAPMTVAAQGSQTGRSGNVAPYVEQQFYDMQTWGDPIAARVVAVDNDGDGDDERTVAELTDYSTIPFGGPPERHYQGIARNSGPDGTPYLYLTRNRNPNRICLIVSGSVASPALFPECVDFGAGEYVTIEMGSRDKGGERLRSNRLEKGKEFASSLPPELDRFVHALRFDGRNGMPAAMHPSGITLIDDVLMIAYTSDCGEADGTTTFPFVNMRVGEDFYDPDGEPIIVNGVHSQKEVCEMIRAARANVSGLLLIDVEDPRNPVILRDLRPFGGGGTPSVVRRANGRYLIGELGGTGSTITFYQTNTDSLRTTTELTKFGSWEVYKHFGCAAEHASLDTPACSAGDPSFVCELTDLFCEDERDVIWLGGTKHAWPDDAQGFSLVRDQHTGELFAFLFDNTSDLLTDGDDLAVMLRIDEAAIERRDWGNAMTYKGSRQFEANDAGHGLFSPGIAPMGDFEAAASIYVSPSGQMILYAAMHDGSTVDGQKIVEMGEFRNRFVTAPTAFMRDTFGYQCGVDLPVTIDLPNPFTDITFTPCTASTGYPGPRCVAPGTFLPEVAQFASVVEGETCRSCSQTLDCQQSAYVSQCGTVFNYDHVSKSQQRFGPGPIYPITTMGTAEDVELALPPYALVEPWVMLHDKYDLRALFTDDDPKMSLMMDWADRDKDDFLDLSAFDSPGAGTFDDDASEMTYCVTPGVTVNLYADSGGGCANAFLTLTGGDATAVRRTLPENDELSCVRMFGTLNKDETIYWAIDGVPIDPPPAGTVLTLDGATLAPGTHTVTARLWNRTAGATVVVHASNRAPAFAASDPPVVNEDSGFILVPGWATFDPTADAGQTDEPQSVAAYVTTMVTNPNLFEFNPGVSQDGTLRYVVASDAFGTSNFTVVVDDTGGTALGGVNRSASHTFTLTVRPVNDAPTFTAANPPAVLEDAGPQSVQFATFSPGPFNEGGQSVLQYFVSDVSAPALFASLPAIDAAGRLTYRPAPDASGSSTFTVRVQDNGGVDNGGADTSAARTFSITVLPVNDAPITNTTGSPATQTVQYSDGTATVTFHAFDIDSPSLGLAPAATLPGGLALSNATCTTQNVPPIGIGSQCRWTLTGVIGAGAGTYNLLFTAGDGALGTTTSTQIIVATEDARSALSDSNPVSVPVGAAGGTSVPFDLSVNVREAYNPTSAAEPNGASAAPGDVSLATVSISLTPTGPGSPVVAVGDCQAGDNDLDGYEQIGTVTCRFDSVPVNTYTVAVSIAGGYYHHADATEDTLVVFDPSLGRAAGGGWLYWPGTQDRVSFSYSIGHSGRDGRPTGNLLVTRRRGNAAEMFRLRSTALVGLSRGTAGEGDGRFGWAAFIGQADGNREFTVYVENPDDRSAAGRFWIEVRDHAGKRIDALSFAGGAQANAIAIQAGAVIIP